MVDTENDLKEMGVRGWRKTSRDRDALKLILKETKMDRTAGGNRQRERERGGGRIVQRGGGKIRIVNED